MDGNKLEMIRLVILAYKSGPRNFETSSIFADYAADELLEMMAQWHNQIMATQDLR